MTRALVRLVDDDEDFRASQRLFLAASGFDVQEWADPQQFLKEVHSERPGCIVLDIRMPGLSGIEVQKQLNAMGSRLPIIILTGHGDVGAAVHTLKNGAVDFLVKQGDPLVFLETVRKACEKSLSDFAAQNATAQLTAVYESLTPREREVFGQAALGLGNKEIADKLGIGITTVRMHRANAFAKTGVKSALEAYRWLEACGIHPGDQP